MQHANRGPEKRRSAPLALVHVAASTLGRLKEFQKRQAREITLADGKAAESEMHKLCAAAARQAGKREERVQRKLGSLFG